MNYSNMNYPTMPEWINLIWRYYNSIPHSMDTCCDYGLGLMPQWERSLLLDTGVIKRTKIKETCQDLDVISCDYPKLVYDNKEDVCVKDGGGVLLLLLPIKEELEKKFNKQVKIKYYPKLYSEYLQAKKEWDERQYNLSEKEKNEVIHK